MQAEMISLDEMLDGLGISHRQLVDLAIMIGTLSSWNQGNRAKNRP